METEKFLEAVIKDSPFAWWEWDIIKNSLKINSLKASMIGYDPKDFENKGYQAFTDLLHPDDLEKAMNSMRIVLQKKTDLYQTDYRIKSASGIYHLYMDRGFVIEKDKDDNPRKIRGIVIDLGKENEITGSIENLKEILVQSIANYKTSHNSFITVCSNCLRVKKDTLNWVTISNELKNLIGQVISHGVCPDCIKKLYPDQYEMIIKKILDSEKNKP